MKVSELLVTGLATLALGGCFTLPAGQTGGTVVIVPPPN